MRFPTLSSSGYAAFTLAALLVAACGSNPGFSGPSYPGGAGTNPVGPQANNGAVAVPSGAMVSATPGAASASASPSAKTTALSVAGATARLAYDGSAPNPSAAQRILILSFSVDNPTTKSASVRRLSIAPVGDQRAPLPVSDASMNSKPLKPGSGAFSSPGTPSPIATATSLNVPASQDSAVQVIALAVPDAIAAYKQLAVTFFPDKGPALASATLDVAPADVSLTPLDSKSPKGALSVDSMEVGGLAMAGAGQHYKVTFAVTNAGTTPMLIDQFVIKPPKGAVTKVSLLVNMLPRTTTSFITVVVPYDGKTLPSGSYQVTATSHGATVASGTGDIL